MRTYLPRFGILAHEGLVRAGKLRGELVDVQHVDGDSHPAGQNWTVWRGKNTRRRVNTGLDKIH